MAELQKTEVTLGASGLCPFETGSKSDPQCGEKAKEEGFWEPWCDASSKYSCVPQFPPAPAPPPVPVPLNCTAAQRTAAAKEFDEVRADPKDAAAAAKQGWDLTELNDDGDLTLQLRGSSNADALCLGVNGVTAINPKHADVRRMPPAGCLPQISAALDACNRPGDRAAFSQVRLLPCNAADTAQRWQRHAVGKTAFQLHHATGCLDLQKGTNMETCDCNGGPNQEFAYDATVGALTFTRAPNAQLLVDVC